MLLIAFGLPASAAKNNLEIFPGHKWEIPNNIDHQVSDATLEHYYKMVTSLPSRNPRKFYVVNGSENPFLFNQRLETHKKIEDELKPKTIFSFIYFDGENIVYDDVAPKDRFENLTFTEESYFPSHSMGKSITSYILGHAICEGYIGSISEEITDWPLMENTLYFGQPLINLLNMTAGDTHVIKAKETTFIKTGRHIHAKEPLLKAAQTVGELKNTSLCRTQICLQ